MSTKHVRSAADLVRFKCALRVECAECGYSRTLNGFEIAKTYGTKTLAQIQQRMKCSRCDAKEAILTVLFPLAPR
jgi:ribosomal protein L44E